MDLKERIIQDILAKCQRHEEALIVAGLRRSQRNGPTSKILEQLRSEEIHTLRDKLKSIEMSLQTLHSLYQDFPPVGGLDRDS